MKNNNSPFLIFILIVSSISLNSCYSFKNVGIPPEIETFFVEQFDIQAFNAPAELGQNFSERLKDKIRQESRLRLVETDPDVNFSGSVSDFRVTSEAPQADQEVAFNRLSITVTVDYISEKNEEISWERPQRFSYFNDFDASDNLIDVQDELIENISQQLVEDIFNKAFTNW